MNENQKRIKSFMNQQIAELEEAMDHLKDGEQDTTDLGSLYNGILKSGVSFELNHMETLKNELIDLFK